MKKSRLLLPFMHGVNPLVIEYAVSLAKSKNAILVPLALIKIPKNGKKQAARLEHIEQAQDFLMLVQREATLQGVPVELVEIFTGDVVGSVNTYIQSNLCEGILFFMQNGKSMLLQQLHIQKIIEQAAIDHTLIHVQKWQEGQESSFFLQRLVKSLQAHKDTPLFVESKLVYPSPQRNLNESNKILKIFS